MNGTNISVMRLSDRQAAEADQLWAATAIAELPVVVTDDPDNKAHEFEVDGNTFRRGGKIVVGSRRFRIQLARGATDEDLNWLRDRVDEAKAGLIEGWSRNEKNVLWWTWSRQVIPTGSRGNLLVLCDDPNCVVFGSADPFHGIGSASMSDCYFTHVAEYEAAGPGYTISVERPYNEPDWRIDVFASDCFATVGQAAGMASDIQYAVGEAKRLNS